MKFHISHITHHSVSMPGNMDSRGISHCLVLCCVFLFGVDTRAVTETCQRIDDTSSSCYYVVWRSGTWFNAIDQCRNTYKADLAMLENQREWWLLVKMINETVEASAFEFWTGFTDEHVWLGAVTLDNHRSFIWYASARRIPIPYPGSSRRKWDPWAQTEPDGKSNGPENCVAMDMRSGPSRSGEPRMGQLNDKKCGERLKGFVCEKKYD